MTLQNSANANSTSPLSVVQGGTAGANFYQTIEENGSALPTESTINFVGATAVVTDNPGIATNITFAPNLNTIADLTPATASLIQGNGTTYVETVTFTSGSVLYSDGTNITQDNANFNWNDTNYTLSITQPSSESGLEPVLVVNSDPAGDHGHGNHINLAGNPAGGATISREDGGLNNSWIQIYGGDYTGTNGGGIYINGNNSTDGDAGGVQTTFGLSTSSFQMYDNTQSILLFQLNNAGVLQLPMLEPNSALFTDSSSNIVTGASGSISWSIVTSNTSMVKSNGYFANSASGIVFTLPATAAIGDTYSISSMNTGGFTVAQNAGQQVRFGNLTTTSGTGGSIASTLEGDGITIVCNVANTGFQVMPGTLGNFNVI